MDRDMDRNGEIGRDMRRRVDDYVNNIDRLRDMVSQGTIPIIRINQEDVEYISSFRDYYSNLLKFHKILDDLNENDISKFIIWEGRGVVNRKMDMSRSYYKFIQINGIKLSSEDVILSVYPLLIFKTYMDMILNRDVDILGILGLFYLMDEYVRNNPIDDFYLNLIYIKMFQEVYDYVPTKLYDVNDLIDYLYSKDNIRDFSDEMFKNYVGFMNIFLRDIHQSTRSYYYKIHVLIKVNERLLESKQ